eukprot:5824752-Pyramimonas_sp.AAC.1
MGAPASSGPSSTTGTASALRRRWPGRWAWRWVTPRNGNVCYCTWLPGCSCCARARARVSPARM